MGTLCPRCWSRARTSTQKWIFLLNCFIGAIGLGFCYWLPGVTQGPVLLNLFLIEMFVIASILPHELGHAWSAQMLGWRVFKIYFGLGKTLTTRNVFGFETEFKAILMMGLALAVPKSKEWFKIKRFVFILAGPLTNLLLAAPVLMFIPTSELWNLGSMEHGVAVGRDFFYANLLMVLGNLWPYELNTPYGKIPSDGKALWKCLFFKSDVIEQNHAWWYLMEGATAHEKARYGDARAWLEKGLEIYPRNLALLNWLAIVLIDLKDYAQSRAISLKLLEHPELNAAGRAMMLNNIAYVDILLGGTDLVAEADRFSQEAMSSLGWLAPIKGTRGSVLVEQGDLENAIPLLRQAMDESDRVSGKAQNACFLAIAEARRGRPTEATKFLEEARRLDPTCFLLPRAESALCDSSFTR